MTRLWFIVTVSVFVACHGNSPGLDQINLSTANLRGNSPLHVQELSAEHACGPSPVRCQDSLPQFQRAAGVEWILAGDTVRMRIAQFASSVAAAYDAQQYPAAGLSFARNRISFQFYSHPLRPVTMTEAESVLQSLGIGPEETRSGEAGFPQVGRVSGRALVTPGLLGRPATAFVVCRYQGIPSGLAVARSVDTLSSVGLVRLAGQFRLLGQDSTCAFPAYWVRDTVDGMLVHLSLSGDGHASAIWGREPAHILSQWARKVDAVARATHSWQESD